MLSILFVVQKGKWGHVLADQTCVGQKFVMRRNPRMGKKFINSWPHFLVFDQTLADEVDTIFSAVLEYLLLKLWFFIKDGVVEDQTFITTCELKSSVSGEDFISQNSQSKDISLCCDQWNLGRIWSLDCSIAWL